MFVSLFISFIYIYICMYRIVNRVKYLFIPQRLTNESQTFMLEKWTQNIVNMKKNKNRNLLEMQLTALKSVWKSVLL